jgi:hypothetical protein
LIGGLSGKEDLKKSAALKNVFITPVHPSSGAGQINGTILTGILWFPILIILSTWIRFRPI